MYAVDVVVEATRRALQRRGFHFPQTGDGIGRDAVAARRLAFDALHNYTNTKASGIGELLGCTAATALVMKQSAVAFYRSPEERAAWLEEVAQEIRRAADSEGSNAPANEVQ